MWMGTVLLVWEDVFTETDETALDFQLPVNWTISSADGMSLFILIFITSIFRPHLVLFW